MSEGYGVGCVSKRKEKLCRWGLGAHDYPKPCKSADTFQLCTGILETLVACTPRLEELELGAPDPRDCEQVAQLLGALTQLKVLHISSMRSDFYPLWLHCPGLRALSFTSLADDQDGAPMAEDAWAPMQVP